MGMPLALSDIAKAPDWVKLVIFLSTLFALSIEIDLFGITFTIGEFVFTPIQFAMGIFGITVTFALFRSLIIVSLLVLFALKMQSAVSNN